MQFLNLLKKYLVDSQIFVSLAGTLLAVFFMLHEGTFRWPTVFLIFITYFSGYLYTKYQHHRHFYKTLIFNVISGIVCALLIFQNHNEIRLVKWLVIVGLGLLYNSSFLENFIRKIPLLKVFYVGLVWALVNSWMVTPEPAPGIFAVSFLFVTALVLPFDIRDMKEDQIVTFPRLIGIQKTKYLAYLLIFSAGLIAVLFLKTDFATAFYITMIFSYFLVYFSKPSNRDAYFSFWVESLSAMPFLFYVLLKYF